MNGFSIDFEFPVSKEILFDYLVNKDKIPLYMQAEGFITPEVNGAVSLFDGWVAGKVILWMPSDLVEFTWVPEEWKSDEESLVCYSLKNSMSGCVLSITHQHFPNQKESDNHRQGWFDYVLNPLDELFQSRLQSS